MERLRPKTSRAYWKWVLCSFAVAFVAATFVFVPGRRYEATALLRVHGPGVDRLARTYADELSDRSFLADVAPRVRPIDGVRPTADMLERAIDAQTLPGSALVRVTARGRSDRSAEALAADVAVALAVAARQDAVQHEALVGDQLRARAAALDADSRRLRRQPLTQSIVARLTELESERASLLVAQARLARSAAREAVGPAVVAAPVARLEPLAPRLFRAFLAGLLAAAFSLALGWRSARRRDFLLPTSPGVSVVPAVEPQAVSFAERQVPATRRIALVSDFVEEKDEPASPAALPAEEPPAAQAGSADLRTGGLDLRRLERLLSECPAAEPEVQAEREAVVFHLRGYTSVGGAIPDRFHALILESFGDLLKPVRADAAPAGR